MGMDGAGLSVADALALSRDNNDGMFGDGGGMWGVMFLFFLLAWGGNGFGFGGRDGGACCTPATQQGMTDAFNFNQLDNAMRGIERGTCDLGYSNLQGFNTLGSQIAENRFASQQCCCETNRNIDSVRYENARNTCDIVNAIREDGALTRAQMIQTEMQNLRDQLNTANLQLSQQAQSANLIATLRPTPTPSYLTCSPYESVYLANRGYCGNSCGCGC